MTNQNPAIATAKLRVAKIRAAKRKKLIKASVPVPIDDGAAPMPKAELPPFNAKVEVFMPSEIRNRNPVIDAIQKAAMGAVTATAPKATNDLNVRVVAEAKPELEAAIYKAVAADPVVQNATNTEAHFWQKRTFWSTLASGGGAAVAAINYFATNLPQDGRITLTFVGFALWAGYSAFRAGRAITPLGTPSQSRYPLNK